MGNRKLKDIKTEIQIENLKCGGCASTIKKGLLSIANTKEVIVNIDQSVVTVISDKEMSEEIKEKLSKLGYPQVGNKNTITHKAKSFVSCAVGRMDL